jgi:hypothetical protein
VRRFTWQGKIQSQFLGGSILSAVSLEAVAVFLRLDFLGVTVGMVTVGFFIIMDWTGSAASHTKAIIARNKGDMDEYESTE